MRYIFYSLLLSALSVHAQSFRLYGVKSGKVEYEITRFVTHSSYSVDTAGKEHFSSEQIPYRAELRTLYWEDYGRLRKLVVYQTAKLGGKPLPKKQKLFEQLWNNKGRYYYRDGKVSRDPNYQYEKWKDDPNQFASKGWFVLSHPHAKRIGQDTLIGKKCVLWQAGPFSDYALWQGIVLQETDYYTNTHEERKGTERKKTALRMEIPLQEKPDFFHPQWLKK